MQACLRLALLVLLFVAVGVLAQAKERPVVARPPTPAAAWHAPAAPEAPAKDVLQQPTNLGVARDSSDEAELRRLARQRRFWQVQALVTFSVAAASGYVLSGEIIFYWLYLTETQIILLISGVLFFSAVFVLSVLALMILRGRIRRQLENPDVERAGHQRLKRLRRLILTLLILFGVLSLIGILLAVALAETFELILLVGLTGIIPLASAIVLDIRYHKLKRSLELPSVTK
jgi:hypothetical protein